MLRGGIIVLGVVLTGACASEAPDPTSSEVAGPPTTTLAAPVIDLTAALPHRMSPEQVSTVVLRQIAADEQRVGRRVVAPRIESITLVPPNRPYDTFTLDVLTWAVRFDGTTLACGSTCDLFAGALVMIDDASGGVIGAHNFGHLGTWP